MVDLDVPKPKMIMIIQYILINQSNYYNFQITMAYYHTIFSKHLLHTYIYIIIPIRWAHIVY
jgi:hypothetical protein